MSFYLKTNISQKHVCPCKALEKSMPQTIDSSSKNDMYIMDFPTAHRLRHKKTIAAQVTTLTLYVLEDVIDLTGWVALMSKQLPGTNLGKPLLTPSPTQTSTTWSNVNQGGTGAE